VPRLRCCPAAWLALSSPAGAQDVQKLTPFLVDLPGWTATDDAPIFIPGGANTIRVTRSYKRGSARIDAGIVIGDGVEGTLLIMQHFVKQEIIPGLRMSTSQLDGFTVLRTFATKDNVSTIWVVFSSNAAFSFVSSGIPEHEAFGLARRLDWKGMQAALP
jgi:hypothetical protein